MWWARLDATRVALWRVLGVAVVVAAGVVITSIATTSSATTVPMGPNGPQRAAGAPTRVGTPVRIGEHTSTGIAVRALTTGDIDDAALPAGFAAWAEYQPVVIDGVLADPVGGCSSPIRLPAAFDGPCKTHDLGYDLLRYGALIGRPMGPWAREALDRQLVTRVRASCARGDDGCQTAVDLVDAGVRANSIRQGDGVPVGESPGQIIVSTAHLLWRPVAFVADALGTTTGRLATAALLALMALQASRGSQRRFADVGLPTLRLWRRLLRPHRSPAPPIGPRALSKAAPTR